MYDISTVRFLSIAAFNVRPTEILYFTLGCWKYNLSYSCKDLVKIHSVGCVFVLPNIPNGGEIYSFRFDIVSKPSKNW